MTAPNLSPVSVRGLSRLTGLDRDYLLKRIAGATPAGKRAGHPVYQLGDVLPLLCRPAAATAGEIDPDALTPTDRKAWYDSEVRRRQLQERDRELIPAAELEACIARVFGTLSQGLRSIPDNLERRIGCSPEVAEAVERMIEGEMNAVADRLAELGPAVLETDSEQI